MNTAESCFRAATLADKCGTAVFYFVFAISSVLLAFEGPKVESFGHPALIVAAALAITCTVVTTIYQTEGNRALRATQLSDALGAGMGEDIRQDYYNNLLPQSIRRLAATTLENTLFTKEILSKMAVKQRFKGGFYFILLVALLVYRETPTNWLLMLAQTLFSADLLLKWIRLERFRVRANRVHQHLSQFFLQNGDPTRPNDMAVLLGAFTDYECAKDEAVMPLEDKIFKRLNPELSRKWQELQERLRIR